MVNTRGLQECVEAPRLFALFHVHVTQFPVSCSTLFTVFCYEIIFWTKHSEVLYLCWLWSTQVCCSSLLFPQSALHRWVRVAVFDGLKAENSVQLTSTYITDLQMILPNISYSMHHSICCYVIVKEYEGRFVAFQECRPSFTAVTAVLVLLWHCLGWSNCEKRWRERGGFCGKIRKVKQAHEACGRLTSPIRLSIELELTELTAVMSPSWWQVISVRSTRTRIQDWPQIGAPSCVIIPADTPAWSVGRAALPLFLSSMSRW